MRNIAMALGLGLVAFALLHFTGLLNAAEASVPAVLAIMVAYFLLARQTFRKVEKLFTEAARYLQQMPPKIDLAIATMEKAYVLGSHQIGVRSQVDSQIGMLHFLQKDFNKAAPYLERSLGFGHWTGGAMLGVIQYKKKSHDEMCKTFDIVVKKAKKQSLAWNLYAYLLCQIGRREEAHKLLLTAVKRTKDDPKVKEALLALQNGKKIKMRGYKEQWYQFHLERPPQELAQAPLGGKISKIARRGRW